MVNLSEVFKELGYALDIQHCNIVKLMVFDGLIKNDLNKEVSESRIISNEQAKKILTDLNFNGLGEAINFLVDTTQGAWLRATHKVETSNAQNQSVNLDRWKQTESDKYKKYREEIINILSSLNMINNTPTWPSDVIYNHVVMHGGLEIPHIKERLEALKPFEGKFYYLTSPRGAFNDEPATAEIIANWLGKPAKTDAIRKVLMEHKDKSNWTNNLEVVKKAILDEADVLKWPSGKGLYYQDLAIYQENGKDKSGNMVRDLKDWPVAADIVLHRFQQIQSANPGKFDKIILIPVPTLGKVGVGPDGKPDRKIANTDDNLELWYKAYGSKLISGDKSNPVKVLFISSEAQREQQHQIALKYLSAADFEVKTICKKAGEIKIDAVLDSFTRLLYAKREGWIKKSSASGTAEKMLPQQSLTASATTALTATAAQPTEKPAPTLKLSANK